MRNDSKKPLFENKFQIKRSKSVYNSLSAKEKLATII